jgi:hypothetical protein
MKKFLVILMSLMLSFSAQALPDWTKFSNEKIVPKVVELVDNSVTSYLDGDVSTASSNLYASLSERTDNTVSEVTSGVNKAVTSISNNVDSITTGVSNGVAYVDTSSLYKTIYSDTKYALTALAEGIGSTASEVFKIYTVQYLVQGVGFLVLFLLLSYALYRLTKYALTLGWKFGDIYIAKFDGDDKSAWENLQYSIKNTVTTIGIVITSFFLLPMITKIPTMLTYAFNPRYYVIQDVIEIIKAM